MVTHDGVEPWLYMQRVGKGNASLMVGKLDVSSSADKTAVNLTTEGKPALGLEAGGTRMVLDRERLDKLLQPPVPPPAPEPTPAQPTAPPPP
jgi:hypothetical protein